MDVRLVNQPVDEMLGDVLVEQLRSEDNWRCWVASAWVRRPALRRIEADLAAFKERVKPRDSRGLFGVDLGGTTREGLELAREVFGQARVFHSRGGPARTFHPKLFMFESDAAAVVSIGSSNFTPGGLWGNFELNVVMNLDLTQQADKDLLTGLRLWFDQWWFNKNASLPVTKANLKALEDDPQILLPSEADVRRVLVKPSGSSGKGFPGKSAFPGVVGGLKSIPKAPKDADDGEMATPVPGLPLDEISASKSDSGLRVLIAGIPFDRWGQVGFNRTVTEDFFHLYTNGDLLWLEGINQAGQLTLAREGALINPEASNNNHRIEFTEPDGRGNPRPLRSILVVLERSFRSFRYMTLMPGDKGYSELLAVVGARPAVGDNRGIQTKRVIVSYADLKAAWPGTPPIRP